MGEAEIRSRLANYLAGRATLRELDTMVTEVAWSDEATQRVRDLANKIALRIGEFSAGQCNEAELYAALRPMVTDYTILMIVGPPPVVQFHTGFSSMHTDASSSVSVRPTFAGTGLVAVPL